MKVILVQNVKNVGSKGDIVNVSDGYANNFLLKNKLAVVANSANLNVNAQEKAQEQKRIKEETDNAKEIAKKLEALTITLEIQVGENGKAFGSIGQKEIADKLSSLGFEIDRKKIDLKSPIKSVGSYDVQVKLYKGVIGKLKLVIIKK